MSGLPTASDMTPLVLIHGIGADGRMFAPVIERLAESARIINWDLPGYGGKGLDGQLTFPGNAGLTICIAT